MFPIRADRDAERDLRRDERRDTRGDSNETIALLDRIREHLSLELAKGASARQHVVRKAREELKRMGAE